MDQLKPEDRLNPEQVISDIADSGKPAFYEPNVDAIIARLKANVKENDVIVVLSNGGFGGIHERLLKEL
jgi:UDP-N-acetylmuramate: L-alanyl-gamma-D-glutamyl-meso-diaminopimelate ligase